jgi:RNA polymerase sigma factor (sigma-70 family)
VNSEDEAIRKLKSGDIAGLKTLVELHQRFAVHLAAVITRDQQMAEDVVSDCFLIVYERIDQFDEDRPFRPWFYRIVVNAALKSVDSNARYVSFDDDQGDLCEEKLWPGVHSLTNHSPAISLDEEEIVRLVRDAILKLTARQKAVLILRYYQDMGEEDISRSLKIPRGTVKSRASAAIQRLRRLLHDLRR